MRPDFTRRRVALVLALIVTFSALASPVAGQKVEFDLRLRDAAGEPLAEVIVAEFGAGDSRKTPSWRYYNAAAPSDEKGQAHLTAEFDRGKLLLYARHEAKGLSGFLEVDQAMLSQPIEFTLVPACRVFGKLTSSDFKELDRPLGWTNVYLFVDKYRPLRFSSMSQHFEFFVPPGKYRLNGYGDLLGNRQQEIEVVRDQSALDLGALDLPAEKLATLIGKQAPELQSVVGWADGQGTTLADLRGKAVVLEFWGHWCGPCVYGMPKLMAWHDDFADRGLVVIGVHDASVGTIEEMQQKLEPIRKRLWSGRKLPFQVALDGGDKNAAPHGATTAAYGIHSFPTSILIDREGRVVGPVHPTTEESAKLLREHLELPSSDAPDFVPTWRRAFESEYRLGAGQILKRISDPPPPARVAFITSRQSSGDGNQSDTARVTVLENSPGEPLGMIAGKATLLPLVRSLVPYGLTPSVIDCPPDVGRLPVTGDWTVRAAAPLADRMTALQAILRDELQLNVTIEPRQVEQEVIVVRGEYKYRPLPGAPANGVIGLTSDAGDHTTERGGSVGDFQEFLGLLSRQFHRRVISEVADPPRGQVHVRQRESAVHDFEKDVPPKLDRVLELLEQQTSLKFEKTRREVEVWFVRHEPR